MTKIADTVKLQALRNAVDNICADVDPQAFDEPINWGDLGCVEAIYYLADDNSQGYRVYIEELAPDCYQFRAYVEKKLAEAGWPNVEVNLSW